MCVCVCLFFFSYRQQTIINGSFIYRLTVINYMLFIAVRQLTANNLESSVILHELEFAIKRAFMAFYGHSVTNTTWDSCPGSL